MITRTQVATAPRTLLERWHELATESMMKANTNYMHNACLHAIHLVSAVIEKGDPHQIED